MGIDDFEQIARATNAVARVVDELAGRTPGFYERLGTDRRRLVRELAPRALSESGYADLEAVVRSTRRALLKLLAERVDG